MKIIYINITCGDLRRYVWRKNSIFPTIPDFQDGGGKSRSRGLLSFRYKVFSVQVDSIQIEVVSRHYRRRFVILLVESWFDSTQSSCPWQGGSEPSQEIFRFELNSAKRVEFCLLKWTAVIGSYSSQVLSIILRLCIVVLLSNLKLCKGTKSYFCFAKKDQHLKNICLFFIKVDRSKMDRNAPMTIPELGLLDFFGF